MPRCHQTFCADRIPVLARQARLQGMFAAHLTISAAGSVISAESTTDNRLRGEHPLLQRATEKAIRNWTFLCLKCAPDEPYDHTLIFVYKLEGEETKSSESTMAMISPNKIQIVAPAPNPIMDNVTIK
jgi:hypothetical protein